MTAFFVLGELCADGRNRMIVICGLVIMLFMWLLGELLWGVKWHYIVMAVTMFTAGVVRVSCFEVSKEAFGYLEEGITVVVEGEADNLSEGYGLIATLKDASVTYNDEEYFVGRILVYLSGAPKISLGDVAAVSGTLSSFDLPRNDGEFNTYNYYKSQGIYYSLKADSVSITSQKEGIKDALYRLRNYLTGHISDYCYDEKDAGTMIAMLLGDKEYLDEELKAKFQSAGISHILVVSGLHISLLGMGVFKLLRKVFKYGVSCSVASVFVLLYVVMTGFGVSGQRALIMFFINMLAAYLGRTYDMLSSIAVALLLMLMDTPYLFLNCGFLLSFLAVIGIAVLCPLLEDASMWLCGHSLSAVMVSVAVGWATLPISASYFFEYPLLSILINLLVIPCMPFLVVLGIVGVGGELLCNKGEILLKGPVHLVLAFYEKLCGLAAEIEDAILLIGKPELAGILMVYATLIMLAALHMLIKQLIKRGIKLPKLCDKLGFRISVWLLIVAGISTLEFSLLKAHGSDDELVITMIDVGQGDSFLIELPNGENMLIDCGSSDVENLYSGRIEAFFKARAIKRLDYIMVSHGDEDHCNAVVDILNDDSGVEVGMLLVPEVKSDEMLEELGAFAKAGNTEVIEISKEEDFVIGGVSFDVLNPLGKTSSTDDKNDNSLVVILRYGEFDMLFTGDIGSTREAIIASGLRKCEVLKVAHHGSKNSSGEQFLEVVSPELALISCGADNSYGHPAAEVLERLNEVGAEVYVTAECGQITIVSDGEKYSVSFKIGYWLLN